MAYQRILVTGSLAFDHIMSMPVRFKDYIMPDKIHMLNVSFIMEQFRKEFGGTGGNITYTLSMLGLPCALVGSAGNDFDSYMSHLEALDNVDLHGVVRHPDVATAQGFVMTDRDDNQIWGFYQGAMKNANRISLKTHFKEGDLLIVSPNDPDAMVNHVREAMESRIDYVYDPAFNIPRIPADKLGFAVKNCKVLVGNDYEIELMRRILKMPEDEFYSPDRIVVTTFGSEGSKIRQGNNEITVPVARVGRLADPTGAGDSYRAGFVAGYLEGKSHEECGRMGAVAAAYIVENYGTQSCLYTRQEFDARLKSSF